MTGPGYLQRPSIWRRVHRPVVYTNHGGNHVRIFSPFSNFSPRHTHLSIFSRLSTSSLTIAFTLALPTSTVTPTPTPPSDPAPRVTYPTIFPTSTYLQRHPYTNIRSRFPQRLTYTTIFSRLSTSILTFLQAVEPNLQRHPYTNIRFGFTSSPYRPRDFSELSTSILTFLQAVKPYLQRRHYTNFRSRFPSSPYLLHDFSHLSTTILTFLQAVEPKPPTSTLRQHQIRIRLLALPTLAFFPTLYVHFHPSRSGGAKTSNVTPTPTKDSASPPRVTHPRIFSRLPTSIFTHQKAVEPKTPTSTLDHHLHAPIR